MDIMDCLNVYPNPESCSFTCRIVPGTYCFQGAFASEDVQALTGSQDNTSLALCCLLLIYTADQLFATGQLIHRFDMLLLLILLIEDQLI